MSSPTPERWTQGDEHNQVVGAALASADTIAPTHSYHRITGTTGIETITPPWVGFSGPLYLVFADAVTFGVTGNVAFAFTSAADEMAVLFYNAQTGKWNGGILKNT